jgi:hypothetical protein
VSKVARFLSPNIPPLKNSQKHAFIFFCISGNISFEDNPEDAKGGCRVSQLSEKALTITAKLIGVDPFELRQALVSRVMLSKGGGVKGTVIM